jgi:hypothetical protein
MDYMKIGPVKAVRVSASFVLICCLISVQFDVIVQSNVLEFSENGSRDGRTFLMDLNETTFTRVA